jgi:hypothetical protein
MADYRMVDRFFSRVWRRSKSYSDHEIEWLARKRHLSIRKKGSDLIVFDPSSKRTVATFRVYKPAMTKRELAKLEGK